MRGSAEPVRAPSDFYLSLWPDGVPWHLEANMNEKRSLAVIGIRVKSGTNPDEDLNGQSAVRSPSLLAWKCCLVLPEASYWHGNRRCRTSRSYHFEQRENAAIVFCSALEGALANLSRRFDL